MQMKNSQMVAHTVAPIDDAGKPAPIDVNGPNGGITREVVDLVGDPVAAVVASTDTDLLTRQGKPTDGTVAFIIPADGFTGTVRIKTKGDADVGDGVEPIENLSEPIEITALRASNFASSFDTPIAKEAVA